MEINSNCYKLFQIADVFITRYEFKRYIFKRAEDVLIDDDIFLINDKDEHYQLIRVTLKPADAYFEDSEEFQKILLFVRERFKKEMRILSIHINEEEYNQELLNHDYLNIDIAYDAGVDLKGIYPEIYTCLHEVDDYVREIYRISTNMVDNEKSKQDTMTKKRTIPFVSLILIVLCIGIYLLEISLQKRFNESAVYVVLGADYKTFTLGLKQYFRLFSNAFLHGSHIHLISNMYSLFFIGNYVERNEGHLPFMAIMLISIIFGSLTQNILEGNSILLGISGGLYGLLIFMFIDAFRKGLLRFGNIIPLIIINLMINFLSSTAWMAHLGGAVGGLIMYLVFKERHKTLPVFALMVTLIFLSYKYVTIKKIDPFYVGTDIEIVQVYRDLGFNEIADKTFNELLHVYEKYGG